MPKTVVRYAGSFIGEKEITHPDRDLAVINPYNQEVIGNISCATVEDVDQAVEKADEVFHESMKKMPAHKRSEILRKTAVSEKKASNMRWKICWRRNSSESNYNKWRWND